MSDFLVDSLTGFRGKHFFSDDNSILWFIILLEEIIVQTSKCQLAIYEGKEKNNHYTEHQLQYQNNEPLIQRTVAG